MHKRREYKVKNGVGKNGKRAQHHWNKNVSFIRRTIHTVSNDNAVVILWVVTELWMTNEIEHIKPAK